MLLVRHGGERLPVHGVIHLIVGAAQKGGLRQLAGLVVDEAVAQGVVARVGDLTAADHLTGGLVHQLHHQVHVRLVVGCDAGSIPGVGKPGVARPAVLIGDDEPLQVVVRCVAGVDAARAQLGKAGGVLVHAFSDLLPVVARHRDVGDAAPLDEEDHLFHGHVYAHVAAGDVHGIAPEDHVAHVGELGEHLGTVVRLVAEIEAAASAEGGHGRFGPDAQVHHIDAVVVPAKPLGELGGGLAPKVPVVLVEFGAVRQYNEPLLAIRPEQARIGGVDRLDGRASGVRRVDPAHGLRVPGTGDHHGGVAGVGFAANLHGMHGVDRHGVALVHHGGEHLRGVGGAAPGGVLLLVHGAGIVKDDGDASLRLALPRRRRRGAAKGARKQQQDQDACGDFFHSLSSFSGRLCRQKCNRSAGKPVPPRPWQSD